MGETEEDGAKPLRQPKKDGSQKPIRQAEDGYSSLSLRSPAWLTWTQDKARTDREKELDRSERFQSILACIPKSTVVAGTSWRRSAS